MAKIIWEFREAPFHVGKYVACKEDWSDLPDVPEVWIYWEWDTEPHKYWVWCEELGVWRKHTSL